MPFPKEFTDLLDKVEELNPHAFKQLAKNIIETNPSIVKDTLEEPPLIFDALSLAMMALITKRKETDSTTNFKTLTHEENIINLIGLLLEKGANPNFVVNTKEGLTAATMFMQFLDKHLIVVGTAAKLWSGNEPREVLSPYLYLMELFVQQRAEFKVDLAKCNFARTRIIMAFLEEAKSNLTQREEALVSCESLQAPTQRLCV